MTEYVRLPKAVWRPATRYHEVVRALALCPASRACGVKAAQLERLIGRFLEAERRAIEIEKRRSAAGRTAALARWAKQRRAA